MTTNQAFLKRHPVLTYYAIVFAISWAASSSWPGRVGSQVPRPKLKLYFQSCSWFCLPVLVLQSIDQPCRWPSGPARFSCGVACSGGG